MSAEYSSTWLPTPKAKWTTDFGSGYSWSHPAIFSAARFFPKAESRFEELEPELSPEEQAKQDEEKLAFAKGKHSSDYSRFEKAIRTGRGIGHGAQC